MKNYVEPIFILASLIVFFCSTTTSAYSIVRPDSDNNAIEACYNACKDFRMAFHIFSNALTTETWEASQKEFSNCQYRCYRCSLKSGTGGMEDIAAVSSNFTDPASQQVVRKRQEAIIKSGFICREKWIASTVQGCTKNPVEDLEPECVN